ncbi:MAG TPA: pilus assembly protein TadG-related protein [Gaiellaceae bacterium]
MTAKRRNESGQALVLMCVFLLSLVGLAALVLDVGSWYRAKRQLQSTADAAALAGAQSLPDNPGNASGLAASYANKNTPDLATSDYSISSNIVPNDRITVRITRPSPGFFAKLFGIDSVDVGARATAQTEGMASAKYVAPIAVKNTHPMLSGAGCPCFGQQNETTIPVGDTGAPGAFALVNLLNGAQGTSGASTLADWINKGFQNYLPLGGYFSDPGVKFNSQQIQDALTNRLGTEMLFPVYDTLTGQGSNAEYHVIGWVGFHIESFDARGNTGTITGWFTEVIWDGLAATTSTGGGPNFGAHTVQLVD